MTRMRSWLVPMTALLVVGALTAVAAAQPAGGGRRGRGRGFSRGSLLGLLRMEQVQKELKLTEDQAATVKKVVEDLTAEMTKQGAALREIEDRTERRAKSTALSNQLDGKARERLRNVLSKEQTTRLGQIRIQVRGTVDGLADKDVVDKLKLNAKQKEQLAQIKKDTDTQRSALFRSLRDATQEKRTEAMQKYRQLRTDAEKAALEVLREKLVKRGVSLKVLDAGEVRADVSSDNVLELIAGSTLVATGIRPLDELGTDWVESVVEIIIRGIATSVMVAASATGPLVVSTGNDLFGSYGPVLLLSAVGALLVAAAAALVPPPTLPDQSDQADPQLRVPH